MNGVYEKLVSCAFDRLPKPVQDAHLVRPVLKTPVDIVGDGFRLNHPLDVNVPASRDLTPKLGIKSWHDSGGLGVIYKGVNIAFVLQRLLKKPAKAQMAMAKAWKRTDTPLLLYLSPYVDFSNISEFRYLAKSGVCRWISSCLRGRSAEHYDARALHIAQSAEKISCQLGDGTWILDFALLQNKVIRIVEVNPGLTPQEVDLLMA